jgi:hypothetical protein
MGQTSSCDTRSQRLRAAGIDINKLRDVAMRVERKPIVGGDSPQWCITQFLFFVFLIAHFLLLVFFTIRNTQDAWGTVLTNSADDTSREGADFIALLVSQAIAVFLYLCALVYYRESYYEHILDVIDPQKGPSEDAQPVTPGTERNPLLATEQPLSSPADVLFFML